MAAAWEQTDQDGNSIAITAIPMALESYPPAADQTLAADLAMRVQIEPFNVGFRPDTTGWVDHLVTTAGARGFMVEMLNTSRMLSNSAHGRAMVPRCTSYQMNRPNAQSC